MLDDFFVRAILAGVGIALIAGPLGCVVLWRRQAYFGDTLSHAALLGVAIGLLLNINLTAAVFVISIFVALMLVLLRRKAALSSDALLGLLSHSSLAIGMVTLSFMTWVRVDLMGLLFGDILTVTTSEIGLIYAGGLGVLAILAAFWRPMVAATLNPDLARAEGIRPERLELIFVVLVAFVIAIAMKIVGVLLITALLIIPAATARSLSVTPEGMAVLASCIGALSVFMGLFSSLEWDTPSGPSIVVAAFVLFVVLLTPIGAQLKKLMTGQVMKKEAR